MNVSLRFQLHDVVVNKQSRSNVWRTHDSLLGSSLLAQQRFKSHNYMGYLISVLFTRITPLIWKWRFGENQIWDGKCISSFLTLAISVDLPVWGTLWSSNTLLETGGVRVFDTLRVVLILPLKNPICNLNKTMWCCASEDFKKIFLSESSKKSVMLMLQHLLHGY